MARTFRYYVTKWLFECASTTLTSTCPGCRPHASLGTGNRITNSLFGHRLQTFQNDLMLRLMARAPGAVVKTGNRIMNSLFGHKLEALLSKRILPSPFFLANGGAHQESHFRHRPNACLAKLVLFLLAGAPVAIPVLP